MLQLLQTHQASALRFAEKYLCRLYARVRQSKPIILAKHSRLSSPSWMNYLDLHRQHGFFWKLIHDIPNSSLLRIKILTPSSACPAEHGIIDS